MQALEESRLSAIASSAASRLELWESLLQELGVSSMAEVGVYRGDFAAHMLREVSGLERYYMVDPWRHLDDWNKPANKSDDEFERFFAEAMSKTEEHADKRVVLRGRTVEVVDRIPDGTLDLAYIDGDHTLRGITTDLALLFPKVRECGFLAGDDFCRNIFQHGQDFEPTLVFPYAVYFAEAVGARIYALPYQQFVMQKVPDGEHAFVDLAGGYQATTLHRQIAWRDDRLARRRRQERQQPRRGGEATRQTSPGTGEPRPSRRHRSRPPRNVLGKVVSRLRSW